METAAWPEFLSRRGGFSIRLPPLASEVSVQCIDSHCGRISTGRWSLAYDAGHLAGPGTHLDQLGWDAVHFATCREDIDGRRALLGSAIDSAGRYRAAVAFEMAPGSGFYLYPVAHDSTSVREFLGAVRTLRFRDAQGRPR